MKRSRRKPAKSNNMNVLIVLAAVLLIILIVFIIAKIRGSFDFTESSSAIVESSESVTETTEITTEPPTETETESATEPEETTTEPETEEVPQPNENGYYERDFEKEIYSYVQCHAETYFGDQRWAGDWSRITAGGQEFHNFGCGAVCLSNIYSTLTGIDTDPGTMYYFARDNSDYNPDRGYGAMSWAQLRTLSEKLGLKATVCTKPDYASFQSDLANSDAAVILVSKDNDAKYWWYTSGHYVTIWGYDANEDSVFITDPSGLFNRVRVLLPDLYNALKTASDAQYMLVTQ